jgi:shikimate kinase
VQKNNLYLIGPMAAGKSTIGKILARQLGREFYDTDAEIIKCTGVEIALIFEIEGEEGFRKRETKKLSVLSELDNVVIATGGGIILKEENRQIMQQTGQVYYLQCSVNQQLSRTKYDTKRPLLQTENPRERLEELMKMRAPLYEATANKVISTERSNSNYVAKKIIASLAYGQ